MKNIDREAMVLIQSDLRDAIAAVARKHGLSTPTIDLRRDRAGSFVRLMKFDMRVMDAAAKAEVVNATKSFSTDVSPDLARALKKIGVTKTTNSKGQRIVAYKSNRPKYPFVYQGPKGGRWKGSAEDMIALFS